LGAQADNQGDLRRNPAGSDREVIAAVRHLLRESGHRPEEIDERAGFLPGTVALLAAGYLEPSGPLLRRLCQVLRIPRWGFYLTGTVVAGAEVGFAELEELLERRRRQLAGNPEQVTDADLVVEAVEIILLATSEDAGSREAGRGSRRGLVDGVKRLARRAQRLGEPGAACLLDAVAVIVLKGVESLPGDELARVVGLADLARSLEDGTEA
jgi:hypothetical protein